MIKFSEMHHKSRARAFSTVSAGNFQSQIHLWSIGLKIFRCWSFFSTKKQIDGLFQTQRKYSHKCSKNSSLRDIRLFHQPWNVPHVMGWWSGEGRKVGWSMIKSPPIHDIEHNKPLVHTVFRLELLAQFWVTWFPENSHATAINMHPTAFWGN